MSKSQEHWTIVYLAFRHLHIKWNKYLNGNTGMVFILNDLIKHSS